MRNPSDIRHGFLAAVVTAVFFTLAPAAHAVDYGPHYGINYGKKLPNGKICRVVLGEIHYHAGNAADRNKARSQRKAIKAWRDFTVFEYGTKYGNWGKARKRTMRCSWDRDKRVWWCRAQAQPCMR